MEHLEIDNQYHYAPVAALGFTWCYIPQHTWFSGPHDTPGVHSGLPSCTTRNKRLISVRSEEPPPRPARVPDTADDDDDQLHSDSETSASTCHPFITSLHHRRLQLRPSTASLFLLRNIVICNTRRSTTHLVSGSSRLALLLWQWTAGRPVIPDNDAGAHRCRGSSIAGAGAAREQVGWTSNVIRDEMFYLLLQLLRSFPRATWRQLVCASAYWATHDGELLVSPIRRVFSSVHVVSGSATRRV